MPIINSQNIQYLLKDERNLRGEFSGIIYSIIIPCKRIKLLEKLRRENTWSFCDNDDSKNN
jgi:hypothetical protein